MAKQERNASWFSAIVIAGCGIVAVVTYVLNGATQSIFYESAHLTSAFLMITLLLASIVSFTRSMPAAQWATPKVASLSNLWGSGRFLKNQFGLYFALALILIAVCLGIVWLKPTDWDHAVLVIEAAALLPFIVYWIMQGVALRTRDAYPGELSRHPDRQPR